MESNIQSPKLKVLLPLSVFGAMAALVFANIVQEHLIQSQRGLIAALQANVQSQRDLVKATGVEHKSEMVLISAVTMLESARLIERMGRDPGLRMTMPLLWTNIVNDYNAKAQGTKLSYGDLELMP